MLGIRCCDRFGVMTPTLQVFLPGWAEIADAERALNRLGSSGRTGVRAARVPSTGFHSWFSLLELPFYLAPKKIPILLYPFLPGTALPTATSTSFSARFPRISQRHPTPRAPCDGLDYLAPMMLRLVMTQHPHPPHSHFKSIFSPFCCYPRPRRETCPTTYPRS